MNRSINKISGRLFCTTGWTLKGNLHWHANCLTHHNAQTQHQADKPQSLTSLVNKSFNNVYFVFLQVPHRDIGDLTVTTSFLVSAACLFVTVHLMWFGGFKSAWSRRKGCRLYFRWNSEELNNLGHSWQIIKMQQTHLYRRVLAGGRCSWFVGLRCPPSWAEAPHTAAQRCPRESPWSWGY